MVYIGSLDYDEQLKQASEIIIFGGGSALPKLLHKMRELGLAEKVAAICDNDITMQGKELFGIKVLAADYICEKYKDSHLIVYNKFFMEICRQLQEKQITKIHLIRQGSL